MQGRRAGRRVPRQLGVVVGVEVDEPGATTHPSASISRSAGSSTSPTATTRPPSYPDVGPSARRAGPVDHQSAAERRGRSRRHSSGPLAPSPPRWTPSAAPHRRSRRRRSDASLAPHGRARCFPDPGAPADPCPRDLGGRPPDRAPRPLRGADARGPGRRGRPGSWSATTATSPGCSRAGSTPTWASTPWSGGRARSGAWSRPASTRCGPGCFDIDARVADMDIAGIWASLCFPSLVAGFCGAVFSSAADRELGPGLHPGVEPLAPRRVGRHPPGADHPPAAPVAGRCRRGRRRGPGQRRAGFRAVSFPEFPAQLGLPSIFTDHWDPFFDGLPGDRHGGLPPHRGLGLGPAAVARAALRTAAHRVPGQRVAGRGRVGVVRGAGALPGPADLPLRGRDRLGAHADGPGRLRARPLRLGHRERHLDLGPAPERGARPELLVLHHRRPVDGAPARPDRRRPRHGGVRLPPRRLHLARHPGRPGRRASVPSPTPPCARWPAATPPPSSTTLSPPVDDWRNPR